MLQAAGVQVAVQPSGVDEGPIKARLLAARAGPEQVAAALALAKAEAVLAIADPGRDILVIGADQVLTCEDQWFDRPEDRSMARMQLSLLRGRDHRLTSAVCLCGARRPAWHQVGHADLRMRLFSDRFLDCYLDSEGDRVTGSVGGYRLEGRGLQLFEAVTGDWFTILGLPLLPLLARLRQVQAIAA